MEPRTDSGRIVEEIPPWALIPPETEKPGSRPLIVSMTYSHRNCRETSPFAGMSPNKGLSRGPVDKSPKNPVLR